MDSKNLSIFVDFCEAGSNISKSGLFLRVLDSMCRTYILSGLSSIIWAYVYFPAGLRMIFINFIYCRGLPWLSEREQRSLTSYTSEYTGGIPHFCSNPAVYILCCRLISHLIGLTASSLSSDWLLNDVWQPEPAGILMLDNRNRFGDSSFGIFQSSVTCTFGLSFSKLESMVAL